MEIVEEIIGVANDDSGKLVFLCKFKGDVANLLMIELNGEKYK